MQVLSKLYSDQTHDQHNGKSNNSHQPLPNTLCSSQKTKLKQDQVKNVQLSRSFSSANFRSSTTSKPKPTSKFLFPKVHASHRYTTMDHPKFQSVFLQQKRNAKLLWNNFQNSNRLFQRSSSCFILN